NPQITAMDSGLHFLIYPADESVFTVFDGTSIRCQTNAAVRTITLNSVVRLIRLQISGKQPNAVLHEGTSLQSFTTQEALDAANAGWWQDSTNDFTFVKFAHPGGATGVTL